MDIRVDGSILKTLCDNDLKKQKLKRYNSSAGWKKNIVVIFHIYKARAILNYFVSD